METANFSCETEPRKSVDGERFTWHTGFYDAIQLELAAFRSALEYDIEHQLADEPLRIDTVVIKKRKGVVIEKNIGLIFRDYNIVEYKRPSDTLTFDDFHKIVGGYAGLYANYHHLSLNEMTVSFVISHYPEKLIARLKQEYNIIPKLKEAGIYYILGLLLPVQLIVTKKLSDTNNMWLKNLNNELNVEEMLEMMEASNNRPVGMSTAAYMHIIFQSNPEVLKEVLEMGGLTVEKVLEETGYIPKWKQEGAKEEAEQMRNNLLNFINNGGSMEQLKNMLQSKRHFA
jgi:hypothetical protein